MLRHKNRLVQGQVRDPISLSQILALIDVSSEEVKDEVSKIGMVDGEGEGVWINLNN